jgi:hypothetical protein
VLVLLLLLLLLLSGCPCADRLLSSPSVVAWLEAFDAGTMHASKQQVLLCCGSVMDAAASAAAVVWALSTVTMNLAALRTANRFLVRMRAFMSLMAMHRGLARPLPALGAHAGAEFPRQVVNKLVTG